MIRETPELSHLSGRRLTHVLQRTDDDGQGFLCHPLGQRGTGDRMQQCERPVHRCLVDLGVVRVPIREMAAVVAVGQQPVPQRGERERFDDVLHGPLGDRRAHEVGITGRRHDHHIDRRAGGADPPEQVQPAAVRQMQVQQHQVDTALGQLALGLEPGTCDRGDGEPVDPLHVGAVGAGRDRLVLDHEHPNHR